MHGTTENKSPHLCYHWTHVNLICMAHTRTLTRHQTFKRLAHTDDTHKYTTIKLYFANLQTQNLKLPHPSTFQNKEIERYWEFGISSKYYMMVCEPLEILLSYLVYSIINIRRIISLICEKIFLKLMVCIEELNNSSNVTIKITVWI